MFDSASERPLTSTPQVSGRQAWSAPRVSVACESVEIALARRSPSVPLAAWVEVHLTHCHECRREASEALRLESLGGRTEGPARGEPDPLFLRTVMARVTAEATPADRARRRVRRQRVAALVAVCVLSASTAWIGSTTRFESGTPQAADRAEHAPSGGTQRQAAGGADAGIMAAGGTDRWDSAFGRSHEAAARKSAWLLVSVADGTGKEVLSF
ncbi:MAG: hypothetical protein AB7O52_01865 [Planctomycetota bacterium]